MTLNAVLLNFTNENISSHKLLIQELCRLMMIFHFLSHPLGGLYRLFHVLFSEYNFSEENIVAFSLIL